MIMNKQLTKFGEEQASLRWSPNVSRLTKWSCMHTDLMTLPVKTKLARIQSERKSKVKLTILG